MIRGYLYGAVCSFAYCCSSVTSSSEAVEAFVSVFDEMASEITAR